MQFKHNVHVYLIHGNFHNLVIRKANAAGEVKKEDMYFGHTGLFSDCSDVNGCDFWCNEGHNLFLQILPYFLQTILASLSLQTG